MATQDLTSPHTIQALFASYAAHPPDEGYRQWQQDLATFLDQVARSSESERASTEFHQRLWEDNKVSSAGRGTIPVDKVIADASFRQWLAHASLDPLPQEPEKAIAYLDALYKEIVERVRPHCTKIPHLKIFRILAALFPRYFTTISDRSKMEYLSEAMLGTKGDSPVARHVNIVHRLEEILGPAPPDLSNLVVRMTFAWYLAELASAEEGEVDRPLQPGPPGAEKLVPLPAVRRRRGLTALRGYIATVLGALEFAREGVTREEMLAYLRAEHPELKETSLSAVINVLQGELHVIRREGDRYVLTSSGQSLLESDDPSVLAPWLITRILGIDHALVALRNKGDQLRSELVPKILAANPGWTSDWMPHSMLSWLKSIGLIEITPAGLARLTSTGAHWASRIDWVPENLRTEESEVAPTPTGLVHPEGAAAPAISLPSFEGIYQAISTAGRFDKAVVAKLHAGIWAHPLRHFAILTGLSGSGKTLLAFEYGKAITSGLPASPSPAGRVCVVAVQPGWSDASALLGYVNPLRPDTYVRTQFLDFLLASTSDLQHPYVAVLDEMNLSHPEQYLAPLLSSMETAQPVDLHREGDVFDGIPSRIPYPANLVLIGTVNMDETTHGLSDKVLDRGFTLEFWDIDVDTYPRWSAHGLPDSVEAAVRAALRDLVATLAPARLHFGWRTIDDILSFIARARKDNLGLAPTDLLDGAIYAKVLPKLRGDDSPRFREALESCTKVLSAHGLRTSQAKTVDLLRDLTATGTARFWR